MLSNMNRLILRNTLHTRVVKFGDCLEPVVDIKTDTRLSVLIKNDILYGVGSRPSLPCCFEDDDELAQKGVDPLADMRHDSWHDASVAMNPENRRTEQTIELGSQTGASSAGESSNDE